MPVTLSMSLNLYLQITYIKQSDYVVVDGRQCILSFFFSNILIRQITLNTKLFHMNNVLLSTVVNKEKLRLHICFHILFN